MMEKMIPAEMMKKMILTGMMVRIRMILQMRRIPAMKASQAQATALGEAEARYR